MLRSVYVQASRLTVSSIISVGQRPSGTDAFDIHTRLFIMVPQNRYK